VLPNEQSDYRVHRLVGNAGQVSQEVRDKLNASAYSLGTTPAYVNQQYMNLVWDASSFMFVANMPIPAAMNAVYKPEVQMFTTSIKYRRPLRPDQFWVQNSTDKWRASLERLAVEDEVEAGDGWYEAARADTIPNDASATNVWGGRVGSSQLYDWHLRVALSERMSPRESLSTFLGTFTRLAKRKPSQLLAEPAKAPTGRGHADVDIAAEILVLNALAALGYPAFYGPHKFETPGVDFVAFDIEGQIAYAISVTTGEDIIAKLGKLLIVRPEISKGLGDKWQLRMVIITTLPRGSLVGAAIESASKENVLVLSGDDLSSLMEESPDAYPFGEALRRIVIAPTPAGDRWR
jgi:hypothetical protein